MTHSHTAKVNPIAQLGHPVLRQPADPVTDILGKTTQLLIENMLATVKVAGGVGIAAPQIHQSKQVFIMCSKPNQRYPNAPFMEPTAIINPVIIQKSVELEKEWEGCLSVPSIRGLVPRHTTITTKYYDSLGQQHETIFSGFLARIFQHEFDHLNGLTFVDRVESTQDLFSEEEWRKQFLDG